MLIAQFTRIIGIAAALTIESAAIPTLTLSPYGLLILETGAFRF